MRRPGTHTGFTGSHTAGLFQLSVCCHIRSAVPGLCASTTRRAWGACPSRWATLPPPRPSDLEEPQEHTEVQGLPQQRNQERNHSNVWTLSQQACPVCAPMLWDLPHPEEVLACTWEWIRHKNETVCRHTTATVFSFLFFFLVNKLTSGGVFFSSVFLFRHWLV